MARLCDQLRGEVFGGAAEGGGALAAGEAACEAWSRVEEKKRGLDEKEKRREGKKKRKNRSEFFVFNFLPFLSVVISKNKEIKNDLPKSASLR